MNPRRRAPFRLGRAQDIAGPTPLSGRRVYILPTLGGLLLAILALVLLVAATNYGANLVFALAFWIVGVGLAALVRNVRNLGGLEVDIISARGVFAGDPVRVQVLLRDTEGRGRWALGIGERDARSLAHVAPRDAACVELALPPCPRGRHALPVLRIESRFPLAVSRAWTWLARREPLIVYPRPAAEPWPDAGTDALGSRGIRAAGGDDWDGLREYRPGDAPRRIHWKAASRSDDWQVKLFARPGGPSLWLDWSAAPGADDETRLARLTRAVVDAEAAGARYGLRLPAVEIAPACGPEHRHACLRALALHGTSP